MEDLNILAADCVVISCCCQCLILQILVFILLKLPYKLICKTREYAKKKLRKTKRNERKIQRVRNGWKDDESIIGSHGGGLRIQVEDFNMNEFHGCGCCLDEVEKVLEELSKKEGEFAFGSFWGRGNSERLKCVTKQEFDYSVVQYHLIEMVGSFNY